MGVDEGNLLAMGVERYMLTSSSHGAEIKIDCESGRSKLFGLRV